MISTVDACTRQASLAEVLRLRHLVMRSIRDFFDQSGFLEVETPALVNVPGSEIHLRYFQTTWHDLNGIPRPLYLRSSPEIHMKRLLSKGQHRIYQIAKSYRDGGEKGDWHHPEFTMLEWYQAGLTLEGMKVQTLALLEASCRHLQTCGWPTALSPSDFSNPQTFSVAEAFERFADLKLTALDHGFSEAARRKGYPFIREGDDGQTAYFKILLEVIEPRLREIPVVILEDFPGELAALCELDGGWARRFEIYVRGVELCNAFQELTDPGSNARLFERVNAERGALGMPTIPLDLDFLRDIAGGNMPASSGNALGVDRWLALVAGLNNIRGILPFAEDVPFA